MKISGASQLRFTIEHALETHTEIKMKSPMSTALRRGISPQAFGLVLSCVALITGSNAAAVTPTPVHKITCRTWITQKPELQEAWLLGYLQGSSEVLKIAGARTHNLFWALDSVGEGTERVRALCRDDPEMLMQKAGFKFTRELVHAWQAKWASESKKRNQSPKAEPPVAE